MWFSIFNFLASDGNPDLINVEIEVWAQCFLSSILLLLCPCTQFYIIHWRFYQRSALAKHVNDQLNCIHQIPILFAICRSYFFSYTETAACFVWGLALEGSVWTSEGKTSGPVHAVVKVSPRFGQVCEDTACVRNTEIGQLSVGVCASELHQYSKHAKPRLWG